MTALPKNFMKREEPQVGSPTLLVQEKAQSGYSYTVSTNMCESRGLLVLLYC